MTTKGKKRFWAKFLSALLIMGLLLNTAGTAALADAGEPTETVKAAEIAQPEAKEPKQTAEPSEEAEVEEAQEPPGEAEVEEAREPSGEAGVEEAQEPSEEAEAEETQEPSEGDETEVATEPPAGTKAEETQEPVEGAVTEEATESTEAETIAEPTEDSVPKEVRAFLEAAKALPSPAQITLQNAEEIGGQVNAVLDLWDVLGEEFSQRSDVTEALESVYAVYEAVLGAEESFVEEEPALYAASDPGRTSNVTKSPYEKYSPNTSGGPDLVVQSSGMVADCYGSVSLTADQSTATDYLQTRYYTNHGGAYATGYTWLTSISTKPNVASATVSQSVMNGRPCLKVDFKPGSQTGTTTIEIGYTVVNLNNEHGIGIGNDFYMYVSGYVYYTVTNNGSDVTPVEKPDAPDKSNVTLPYVFIQCQDSTWDKTNHSAPAKLFYDGETTIEPGEVIENTSAVSAFKKSDYPYQCTVKLKGDYYVNLWNRSLAGRLGTHYLHSEPKDITFYYSAAEGKWKCPTSSLIYFNSPETGSTYGWLVKITKKKPVEPDPVYYSVCYTDGVKGEIVFSDQVKMGLEVNAETPKFVMQADTVKENGDGTTTTIIHTEELSDGTVIPHREGYTFKGWSLTSVTPNRDGVQKKVAAGDANGNKEIIYTARWEKNPTVEIGDLTATKTSSKSAVIVGEEFKYTIKVENDSASSAVVKITDVLDKRLNFSRVSESDGGVYDEKTHTVTWENITVPANGSKNVLVWVRANTAGSIDNMATVTLEDKSIDTNEVTVTVTKPEPEPAPELKVTKTVDPAFVEVGKSVTYTITVTNTGNADASNVTVTDTLDKKLDFKSADNGGSYVSDTRT
ncbi:MAG: DUF11 domain-containing protein, partial [Lachnospiraceae bacterium]|nr:DUF11 domain-containing protein [Lachnospiraceae bacterium]